MARGRGAAAAAAAAAAGLAWLAGLALAAEAEECWNGACAAARPDSDHEETGLLQLSTALKQLPFGIETPAGSPSYLHLHEHVGGLEDETGQFLMELLYDSPKGLPKSDKHCENGMLDCLDPVKRKRCPQTCGIADEMLSSLPSRDRDVPPARTRFVAQLQSRFESRYKALQGQDQQLPGNHHNALHEFESALAKVAAANDTDRASHISNLGYELAVIEALMFQLGLTEELIDVPKDAPNAKAWLNFANVIEQYGCSSAEAHAFFDRAIYLSGEHGLPADPGWLLKCIATLRVYSVDGGLHTYRKVPWKLFPKPHYDGNFAVHSLPDTSESFKIGVVADWGTGSPQALQLLQEMKKQNLDMIIHLGDVYYTGTVEEQRTFFLEPMRAVFGETIPILTIPGNHDYYDGGQGFYDVIDDLGIQEASYFTLRGSNFQIVAIDTGLLDNFCLVLNTDTGVDAINKILANTMTFLPEDQFKWARHQLMVGKKLGLKTIMMSHHQLFSAASSVGRPNAVVKELSTLPDRLGVTYYTNEFATAARELPGSLPPDAQYAIKTRLWRQFPPQALEGVAAWFWGHEHSSVAFEPYAGLRRGRCAGNGAVPVPKDYDAYQQNPKLDGRLLSGLPKPQPGVQAGKGDLFWNIGFMTLEFRGEWGAKAQAKYFHMQDSYTPPSPPTWGEATEYFSEDID